MSLDSNITRIHRPARCKPTVYVAWSEDLWQQGDPMFYSIKDRRQVRADAAQEAHLDPPAGRLEGARGPARSRSAGSDGSDPLPAAALPNS